ncbi:MAG TPA: ferrous iron transport protein B [Phycisphaerae bacterium]|nr:ferrous iron transport protein B [Phycisphaerae bacterium]
MALAGNPNVGKTTLFNALTGLRQKVANYPGVTVEKKSGSCQLPGGECTIVDLPGTYSLASRSPDEHVARQVVLGQIAGTPRPDVIAVVADASNLERNLYLVTQVLELGRPVVVALSMVDVAQQQGKRIDVEKLSRHLRTPVVAVAAHKQKDNGVPELKAAIARAAKQASADALTLPLPEVMETHIDRLKKILATENLSSADQAYFDAHLMISTGDEEADGDLPDTRRQHPKVRAEITAALAACEAADVDPIGAEVEAHYAYINNIVADCFREEPVAAKISRTDRIDRIVTHRVWGMGIFVALMGLMFWAIFSWAQPVMDFLSDTVVNKWVAGLFGGMNEGPLKSLITDGVIAGVGNVVVFLPQIALLFLFLAVLEDSGYMSRAAFLMDRLMSRVGLHGKSFIPLLSGYACAVPAIMGTRVIENRRDRLATILILPLMSCSARLPVYALFTALFFPVAWQAALVMLSMYLLGTFSAFGLAWVFKRTLLKGPAPAFILEMPPYRLPHWKVVITTVTQRSWAFVKRAGTIIFAFSVVMWAATHYPKPAKYSQDYNARISKIDAEITPIKEQAEAYQARASSAGVVGDGKPPIPDYVEKFESLSEQRETLVNAQSQEVLEHSVAGRTGRFIAPVFYPLGYDWKASIGVAGAFFAREVIVSTMGIVYSVGEADETSSALRGAMRDDVWPQGSARAGQKIWTPLTAISLMVFVVFCMQCLSTLAIAKKETGHWGWPVFMFFYMTALAWVAAFVVYQGGMMLGLGK